MVLTFNINRLSPHVPHTWFQPNTRVVSVESLRGDVEDDTLENVVIHLRVLSCTISTSTMRVTYQDRRNNNRNRFQNNVHYNRYFLCADVSNPPHCFVIMTRTSSESASLLQHTHGNVIIGSDFYIFEPDVVNQYIGKTPLLTVKNHKFLPLVDRCVSSLDAALSLRSVELRNGQAGYFVQKNLNITLSRCSLVENTTCNGIMCDRQRDRGECTCLFTQAACNSYVYSFDVTADIPSDITGTRRFNVRRYKSLRTSNCFFTMFERRDISVSDELSSVHTIRTRIRNIVNHVNNNGGWTIVVWMKKGEIADHGNQQEQVENVEVTQHITYLEPTQADIMNTPFYRGLLISDDLNDVQQPQQPQQPHQGNNENNNDNQGNPAVLPPFHIHNAANDENMQLLV